MRVSCPVDQARLMTWAPGITQQWRAPPQTPPRRTWRPNATQWMAGFLGQRLIALQVQLGYAKAQNLPNQVEISAICDAIHVVKDDLAIIGGYALTDEVGTPLRDEQGWVLLPETVAPFTCG